jgi:energy-converting hydrogenase Eha subunit B
VTDPVVAVGGSVTVLGRVDDDVVAVGGSVRLGPRARVRGDVTAVGGRVDQERGAQIGGTVNEVRIGPQFDFRPWHVFAGDWFDGWNVVGDGFRFAGTLLRVSLVLLLALIVALVAAGPVERIGERAGRDPWLSGFTGLLAQLLFIPVLVLTVVILAVSIIGIPLLVLVPFGIIAFLLAVLVGFAGVAHRIGRWAVGPDRPVFVALAVGVVLVSAVALLTRLLSLLPLPLWPVTWVRHPRPSGHLPSDAAAAAAGGPGGHLTAHDEVEWPATSSFITRSRQLGQMPWLNCTSACSPRYVST